MLGSRKAIIGFFLAASAFVAGSASAAVVNQVTFNIASTDGGTPWSQSASSPQGGTVAPYDYDINKPGFSGHWSGTTDADPVVTSALTLTNNTAFTQTFTSIILLPISPALPGATLMGGSMSGSVTDNTGDIATVAAAPGSALYTALIDGLPVATLHPDPYSKTVVFPFISAAIDPDAFGTPIPSQVGPPALSTIGIQLKFTLTPGDSVAMTSVFVVTPEPASLSVLALAGVGLLGRRRRA